MLHVQTTPLPGVNQGEKFAWKKSLEVAVGGGG